MWNCIHNTYKLFRKIVKFLSKIKILCYNYSTLIGAVKINIFDSIELKAGGFSA